MKSLKMAIDQAVVENFEAKRANITKDIANTEAKLANARCLYDRTIKEDDDAHNSSFSDASEISETYINLIEKKNILLDKLNNHDMAYAAWKADAGLADMK